jgi:predicted RNA-binding protein with RPS1 domain
VVQVRVLGVDVEQKRISLSMKKPAPAAAPRPQGQKGPKGGGRPKPAGKPKRPQATVDQLVNKFNAQGKSKQNNVKLQISIKELMRSGR